MDVVKDILATPTPPLPDVERVVDIPVMAEDGTIAQVPGYHSQARTFYAPCPDLAIPVVPQAPTSGDVARAVTLLLDDLLIDFPFVHDAGRAHAVALFLHQFVRPLIYGPTPLHVIDKPLPGTGGTLLAEVLLAPSVGASVGIMAEARLEDEFRFRITSALMTQPEAVVIDNVRAVLDSAALAAAITADRWNDRPVRSGTQVSVPVTCAWVVTGNEVRLSGELERRALRIRLDAGADPTSRWDFKHQRLRRWATSHRGELIWAALVLGRAWHCAGRPLGQAELGSFESYAEVMGGILDVAGIRGFLANRHPVASPDIAIERFVGQWASAHDARPVFARDLLALANGCFALEGKSEKASLVSLGRQLINLEGRRFGDFVITAAGKRQGARMFRLEPVAQHQT
jgi:hypothetical protein